MQDRRTAARREAGFSLIELMVVITIIGILGGIVGVNVFTAMADARIENTKSNMRTIENGIKLYRLKKHKLPDDLSELVPEYIESEEVPKDAWDRDFEYAKEGAKDYTLVSLGADNTEGGEGEDADIDRAALRKSNSAETE